MARWGLAVMAFVLFIALSCPSRAVEVPEHVRKVLERAEKLKDSVSVSLVVNSPVCCQFAGNCPTCGCLTAMAYHVERTPCL